MNLAGSGRGELDQLAEAGADPPAEDVGVRRVIAVALSQPALLSRLRGHDGKP
jgi:hypothetical protein